MVDLEKLFYVRGKVQHIGSRQRFVGRWRGGKCKGKSGRTALSAANENPYRDDMIKLLKRRGAAPRIGALYRTAHRSQRLVSGGNAVHA